METVTNVSGDFNMADAQQKGFMEDSFGKYRLTSVQHRDLTCNMQLKIHM